MEKPGFQKELSTAIMTIYEDLLSDQKTEKVTLDFAPELIYKNQSFQAAATTLELSQSETELLSLKLTFQATHSEEIQILEPLFASCDYTQEEVRAFLNTPKARVLLSFGLKPAPLASYSQQILAQQSIVSVFRADHPPELHVLHQLDLAYDLIKIEVEME